MTDMNSTMINFNSDIARTSPFEVEEIFWGYKVRSGYGAPVSVIFGQILCFFFGVCLLTATFGVLVLPTLFFDGGAGMMRVGAAALMGMTAAYLLWFASRGTVAEVHVDTKDREICEVVPNRVGRPSVVGIYAFDAIGGVFLEQIENADQSQLVLRYRDTDLSVSVAVGTEAQLTPLRDRLARDLLGMSPVGAPRAA